jgi:DNA-directed RNA polymerase subunit M/transcription elongation factor TFIIS
MFSPRIHVPENAHHIPRHAASPVKPTSVSQTHFSEYCEEKKQCTHLECSPPFCYMPSLPELLITPEWTSTHPVQGAGRMNAVVVLLLKDTDQLVRMAEGERVVGGRGLAGIAKEDVAAAIQTEHEIYTATWQSPANYTARVLSLVRAMTLNPKRFPRCTPEMARTPAVELMRGTSVAEVREQIEGHEAKFRLMLEERFEDLERQTASGGALMSCNKCKSSRVITNMRQVRSADESMTCFVQCLKCRANYRLD